MSWLFGIVMVAVLGATALLYSGRLGEMPELPDDHPVPELPKGDFDAASLAKVRFATTTRGYQRSQVDSLMKRAGANLSARSSGEPLAPADLVDSEQIRDATFDVVTGGYLMSQVDAVLERLARQFDSMPPDGEHVAEAESGLSVELESSTAGQYLGQRRANSGVDSPQSGADTE